MINRYLLVTVLFFISIGFIYSQEGEICGSTIQAHQQMMEESEEYKQRVLEWRKRIDGFMEKNPEYKNPNCANGPLKIPVAIHFDGGIVPAGQEACAIDVALNQIAELNNEIRGLDVDAPLINNFAACFGPNILGDACMEFCIGQFFHPSGYGLVDGDYAVTFDHPNVSFSVPSGNFTPVNPDWDAYVNIYVDQLPGGLLGVSNGIPGSFNGDGVLVDNCVFGTGDISCPGAQFTGSAGCFANFAEGEVLAHELGHYFGLFHIWGDNSNCSGGQDQIPDTPDMTTSYSSYTACGGHNACSDLPQTCGTEDMYMNFMSYAGHACMYMFSSDQVDVMYATAVTEGYTTSAEICDGEPPIADFTPVGPIDLCGLGCIDFFDQSTGTPDTWNWGFAVTAGDIVIDINSSTAQNPRVCVTSGTMGQMRVLLTATNSAGSDSEIKVIDITVLPQQIYYEDTDADGFGIESSTVMDCTVPPGYASEKGDCNDNDPNINPDVPEICDGIDNDCNMLIDDGFTFLDYFADTDGDGFGDPNVVINDCEMPTGYVLDNTDCNDNDAMVNPGEMEVCDDNIDNNCDGQIDEGCVLPECDGEFLVINTITMDTFNAEVSVTSGALINNGQDIQFTAGTEIELEHPFEVVTGTTFEAKIQPCLTSPINAPENAFLNAINLKEFEWTSLDAFSGQSEIKVISARIYNQEKDFFIQKEIDIKSTQSILKDELDQLEAGIYFIEIQSGNKVITEKLVLLK